MDITASLNQLSEFLFCYYGEKVLILLEEYDTPMQEAYVRGYWDELVWGGKICLAIAGFEKHAGGNRKKKIKETASGKDKNNE